MKKEDHNQSLLRKLEQLSAQQNKLQREIEVLRSEISKEIEVEKADEKALADEILQTFEKLPLQQPELPPIPVEPNINKATTKDSAKKRIDFERFIGENLISKIGIVIIIIGVGIGAKYAIENQLVSPLIRIIIGYFIGVFMGIIAIRLRGRYLNFSAVLLSGAIAILYFITYAAYSYYSMMPQLVAFILMLLFTSGAVYTALSYNQQVIAHFGLVGAYAVPLLLSDNTGNVLILFSYVGIINLGILFLSIKKYWKPLYYLSFIVTWLLFVSWQIESFKSTDLFVGSFFAYLFFIIFYVAFLSYKVIKREQFGWADLLLVLSNSFVFYAVGYSLAGEFDSSYSLGIFTLSNALLHFIVYLAIYSRRNIDKNLRRLAMSIAIVFLVIAVPVQLDGSWVTLLWIGMALSLFYVGRTNKNWVYEGLSYPLLALSFLSILHDWLHASADNLSIVFNVYFLATLLYILALGAIFYINRKYSLLENSKLVTWQDPIEIVATVGMIISVYFLFVFEINRYWNTTGGSDLYYQRGLLIQISDLIYAIALVAGFSVPELFSV